MTGTNRPTRIIIAGSRSITGREAEGAVDAAMSQFTAGGPTRGRYEIVSGGAEGVDQQAKKWAERYDCEFTAFDPNDPENTMTNYDWDRDGKKAGPLRNKEMAEYGDRLVAIWDGKSRGTRNMINKALDHGLDVYVVVNSD